MRIGRRCRLKNYIAAIAAISISLIIAPTPVFGGVVINEVLYDPPGKDAGSFVELAGTSGMSLNDYFLIGVNGSGGKEYNRVDLTGYSIPLSGFFVVAQDENVPNADLIDSKADFQNSPDSIQLWRGEELIDAVGYGDFSEADFAGEGTPTLDLSGYSIGRRPDGLDSDDNCIDFVGLAVASPGEPNGPSMAVNRAGLGIVAWGVVRSVRWEY